MGRMSNSAVQDDWNIENKVNPTQVRELLILPCIRNPVYQEEKQGVREFFISTSGNAAKPSSGRRKGSRRSAGNAKSGKGSGGRGNSGKGSNMPRPSWPPSCRPPRPPTHTTSISNSSRRPRPPRPWRTTSECPWSWPRR